jgi:hypothetical protein
MKSMARAKRISVMKKPTAKTAINSKVSVPGNPLNYSKSPQPVHRPRPSKRKFKTKKLTLPVKTSKDEVTELDFL